MILTPKRATWKRWLRLSTTQYSLLRSLQYEQIEGLALRGRTLDIGGGQRNSYYHLLRIEGTIESVNIDPKIVPTILSDLNHPLPIASASYDNVISFNTFEHIQNDRLVIAEAVRVLKPNGQFHFMIPFLYRVHASPSDYHRHTAFWWVEFLKSLALSPEQIVVEPLTWSPLSSAFSLVEFRRFRGLRKKWIMLRAVLSQMRWSSDERLPDGPIGEHHADLALGYYVHGTK